MSLLSAVDGVDVGDAAPGAVDVVTLSLLRFLGKSVAHNKRPFVR